MADIYRRARISQATYFKWKKRYDGMLPPDVRRQEQLEGENAKFSKFVSDLSLDKRMLQDDIRRKMWGLFANAGW